MMRSTNPALSAAAFQKERSYGVGESMSIQGTVNKTFFLLFLLVCSAYWAWNKIYQPVASVDMFGTATTKVSPILGPMFMVSLIAGAIIGFVTVFKKQWARITAPIYAVCEGVVIGSISAFFELRYPGIVIQAASLTFATLFCMLGLYRSGIIKVTEKFRMGIVSATGAICLFYFVSFIMGFFGASTYSYSYSYSSSSSTS